MSTAAPVMRLHEGARVMDVEALTLHMAGMIEDGEALPEPSTLDQLAGDAGCGGVSGGR